MNCPCSSRFRQAARHFPVCTFFYRKIIIIHFIGRAPVQNYLVVFALAGKRLKFNRQDEWNCWWK